MQLPETFRFTAEVEQALSKDKPIVALESSIWCQGLPYPQNLDGARRVNATIRALGAVPAVLAVADGQVRVGLEDEELAIWCEWREARKVGMRDLGWALATRTSGATTVSACLAICSAAKLPLLVTGGIGGVHLGPIPDISTDLQALGQFSVCVVSSGAKSILDIEATLEHLETLGVPVVGHGTDSFPVFYVGSSRWPLTRRLDDLHDVATAFRAQRALGLRQGMLVAVPVPPTDELPAAEVERWVQEATGEADRRGIRGQALTPFLLEHLHRQSQGGTLRANLALIENNARVGAGLARQLAQ